MDSLCSVPRNLSSLAFRRAAWSKSSLHLIELMMNNYIIGLVHLGSYTLHNIYDIFLSILVHYKYICILTFDIILI
jgi:hypothetical protein